MSEYPRGLRKLADNVSLRRVCRHDTLDLGRSTSYLSHYPVFRASGWPDLSYSCPGDRKVGSDLPPS